MGKGGNQDGRGSVVKSRLLTERYFVNLTLEPCSKPDLQTRNHYKTKLNKRLVFKNFDKTLSNFSQKNLYPV